MINKEKLMKLIDKLLHNPKNTYINLSDFANEIIKQFPQIECERLKVKIDNPGLIDNVWHVLVDNDYPIEQFETKQEAIDFCRKYNLEIIND